MTVTTGHGDTFQAPIPAEALADLIRALPDEPEYRSIFDQVARHPAMRVRVVVAQMDNLSADVVLRLADDPSADVRRQLVSSRALHGLADNELVSRLIASDPTVADAVAEYLHDFRTCDVEQLEHDLARHPDPSVRLTLARNGQVSDRTLARLARDHDPSVASAASDQLGTRLLRCCPEVDAGAGN
ncbi:MAG: hypothetical protein U0795_00060 [Pirellulales bacterium]